VRAVRRLAAWAVVSAAVIVWHGGVAAAANIIIINNDSPGEGFNDPTAERPVGGNNGATLGEQRLIAFQFAANLWGALLDSNVDILVDAQFNPLPCQSDRVTLGSAGPNNVHRDFAGAPLPNTFYPDALADKLAGTDVCAFEGCSGQADIVAEFSSSLGTTCPFPAQWYYGLDGNPPQDDPDLVTTVLHELGHGLGFLTLYDGQSGAKFLGSDDIFMRFLEDYRTGKLVPDMSDAERRSASVADGNLVWVGPNVVAASGRLAQGATPEGYVLLYAPPVYSNGGSVSHWDTSLTPDELMEPFDNGPLHDVGLAYEAFLDMGWGAVAVPTATPPPSPTPSATVSPTRIPTRTPSRTASRTATATVTRTATPSRTPSPSRTPRLTPLPPVVCAGDCDGNGRVDAVDLIRALQVSLWRLPVSVCEEGDINRDGDISVDEVVAAVGSAMDGCPMPSVTAEPSATATATEIATPAGTATATLVPAGIPALPL
jgi:hypothetical protein